MIYLFFGPPAAGKSTQAQLLAKRLGIPHISIGALLWQRGQNDPALKEQLNNGNLLDSALVQGLFETIHHDHPDNLVLDGALRLPDQVNCVASLWPSHKLMAIAITLPDELVYHRTTERASSDDKNRPYDARPDIVQKRIATYRLNHDRVVDELRLHRIASVTLDGSQSIDVIHTTLLEKLGIPQS